MILDPTTDRACLGQLTRMARELVPTTLVRTVATRLGSRARVLSWFQSLPQSDDEGEETYRAVACDVNQRTRLFPDDPNCFERSFGALALLEVIDPKTARMLVTVERPLRHTGVVERHGRKWIALDLFPRRNSAAAESAKDVLQGVHKYVGKPILTFYGLGGVADAIGQAEDAAIGRSKKQPPPSPPQRVETRAEANRQQTKGGTSNEEVEGKQARAGETGASDRASAAAVDGDPRASQAVAQEEGSKRWGWA